MFKNGQKVSNKITPFWSRFKFVKIVKKSGNNLVISSLFGGIKVVRRIFFLETDFSRGKKNCLEILQKHFISKHFESNGMI